MGLNVVLSLVLMGPLGHGGLALSVSIAAIVEALILYRFIGRRLRTTRRLSVAASAARACAAAAIMGAAVLGVRMLVSTPTAGTGLAFYLTAGALAGAVVYFMFASVLGSDEARTLWKGVFARY